jgi:hypothetical protein
VCRLPRVAALLRLFDKEPQKTAQKLGRFKADDLHTVPSRKAYLVLYHVYKLTFNEWIFKIEDDLFSQAIVALLSRKEGIFYPKRHR